MVREEGLNENTNEFVIEWLKGETHAFVTVPSSTALKNKILSLADKYPDEVEIIKLNPDGSMYSKVPVRYITVRHPRVMSEESKEKAKERLAKIRGKNYERN